MKSAFDMVILGINAYHGDAGAALLVDNELVAAVEEERFTRVKHSAGFPVNAVRHTLRMAGVGLADLDHVAIARKPRARLLRKLFHAARLPRFALERSRVAMRSSRLRDQLAKTLGPDTQELKARVHRVEHHRAHLASAFLVSPFDRAALLSLDGLGDFASGMWGVGEGNRMHIMGSVTFPHSVGMFYTALTQYLGFWKYGDEYKVMGLAAYGQPDQLDEFRQILRTNGELGYKLDLPCFTHHRKGPGMTWESGEPVLDRLFSAELERRLGPARRHGESIDERHEGVAASLQARLEELVLQHVQRLLERTRTPDLAYAGGVAFNCVANGKALEQTPLERLYVPPAAGDAGLAVGAAYYVWHHLLGHPREFRMDHAFWGPEFSESQMRRALDSRGRSYRCFDPEALVAESARRIAAGKVVGWFQGRTEWGPRALGNRSIVADPRRPEMREVLNRRIKLREPFRPFAPSVLEERVGDWFTHTHPSRFMSVAYGVRPEKRTLIPATTHVDGTARLQTVSHETNPLYWELIRAFERETGVPIVLNTSFNENEPIVNSPEEAVDCFLRTEMDVLVLGPFLVERAASD